MIESECRTLQLMQLGGKVGDGAGWRLRHGLGEFGDRELGWRRIDGQ